MANAKPRKRPCCICRTWFLPDVRQVGRQTTCSQGCRREKHRRQCKAWNHKNKHEFKSSYLQQKLEQTNKPPPKIQPSPASSIPKHPTKQQPPPASRLNLHVPYGVIKNDISIRQYIILQYLFEQAFHRFGFN